MVFVIRPKKIPADYDYLLQKFGQGFLDEVKEAGLKKSIQCIAIPPEWSSSKKDVLLVDINKGPDQKYYQKEGEKTCLTISFANMLCYCNS